MPYIKQEDRTKYEPETSSLKDKLQNGDIPKGELTYLVYSLGISYFRGRESYTHISAAIGALNDASEEIRRRHLNHYEDNKIQTNGDIE